MPVTSPFLLYVGTTAYDLRKVSSWSQSSPETEPLTVQVRFIDMPERTISFDMTSFETAMQACLDASV